MKLRFALLSLFSVLIPQASAMADDVDARDYFTGEPWGWGVCSDATGTAYQLNGGLRAAQPRTIVLKSNGSDNATAIKNAINQYDIIVLDGSAGTFSISSLMAIDNVKNRTIVGRNNAVLATEFYLTADDIAYLKAQGLENMSSTEQYTGTLPNGTTMTCDYRAFFTKKAMMELQYQKSGEYTLPRNAGIFQFGASCENIIVRNLTLQGPGAVDIDGSDLLYDAYATHLWVDHCTFIDSQDGALDTRGSYNTYTWNHFYYTDRSYSHAYTCGMGWVTNHSTMLYVTWGQNIWGKGCQRRLPQASDCYLHLVNNYHNCSGNSVGMTLNDYTTALVEGNFAATGVNSPLTGSGENRYIYARNNSFTYTSTSTSVTVPYEYSLFSSYIYVPSILTAKHGAGAKLDSLFMPFGYNSLNAENFGFYASETDELVGNTLILPLKNLCGANYTLQSSNPEVVSISASGEIKAVSAGSAEIQAHAEDSIYGQFDASIKVNVTQPSAYQTVKLWNFKSWSSTTLANIQSDGSNWSADGSNYTNVNELKSAALTANGVEMAETEGLKFTSPATKMVLYTSSTGSIRLNKETCAILIPDLKKDDKVILNWKSANSSSERGFNAQNLSVGSLLTISSVTKEAAVVADGDVSLAVTGGIYVYSIEVQRQSATGIEERIVTTEKSEKIYTLSGNRLSSMRHGLQIRNGYVILVK